MVVEKTIENTMIIALLEGKKKKNLWECYL